MDEVGIIHQKGQSLDARVDVYRNFRRGKACSGGSSISVFLVVPLQAE